MTISFKILGPEAAEMLSEMHRLSFQEDGEQIWSAEEMASLLLSPGAHVMVVSDKGEPTGFLMWREAGDEAEIITICVLPALRSKGMASQLLQKFYGKTKDKDVRQIFLEVNENNKAALMLYEKNGFETVGRRKDYYGGRGVQKQDALIMKYSE